MASTQKFGEQAKDTASSVADKAKDTASNIYEKAKDMGSSAYEKVKDTASSYAGKVDDAAQSVGSGIKSMGDTVRDHGPRSGILGSATSAVSGALDSAGGYLEEKGLSGIGGDFGEMIRRNPMAAMAVGFGLGFLLARLTSSRS